MSRERITEIIRSNDGWHSHRAEIAIIPISQTGKCLYSRSVR